MDTPPTEAEPQTCYRHPDRRAGVRCQRCERLICPSCMSTASVGFHCPDCTKSGKQTVYTRANLGALNRPIVTQVLIGINAIVFVAGILYESRDAFAGRGGFTVVGGLLGETVFYRDIGLVEGVEGGEWYRIFTSGFLHAGAMHILFNMLALFQLGGVLEPTLGRARFVSLYVTSLVTGGLGVLVLSPDQLTVGASGAVFGLMGALVIAQRARGIDPWSSGIGGLIGINLFLTFAIPGISIGGHLGGLVGGLVAGWLLLDAGPKAWPRQPVVPLAAVAALGVLAFGACLAAV